MSGTQDSASATDAARGTDPEGPGFSAEIEQAIAKVRADVARLHGELTRYGLVVWTGGNVSGRVPGAELFVIKPSGVSYDELAPENMILCDLDGNVIEGTPGSERAPSSDTAAHAYVYRNMPEVGGVVHTHSTFAVAWAARGEEIPCVITAMADEFGGPVPVGPFAVIGDDSIAPGASFACGADAESWAVHDRGGCEGCGQGCGDGRGRGAHGASRS
jgi:L-ribulose-5-phosphate 4-epimerase